MKTSIMGFTPAIAIGALLFCAQAAAQLKFPDGTTQSTAFGGENSQATGTNATVSGGTDNTASGNFAARFVGSGRSEGERPVERTKLPVARILPRRRAQMKNRHLLGLVGIGAS